ncbi:YidH family protein [Stackebrandtia endophytica]|uniref:YidH family protein n=1 Tax=Stackebrandtia endophytica TaxID=1496996 RepID=UPI00114F7F2F|nr:DUF202 domain-containing protein [Stackebrandtia endophytica]
MEDDKVNVVAASLSPSRLRQTGTTPDYRFSLANERTFLAWLRTALALVAGGIAIAQFLPPLRTEGLREGIAGVLLLLGSACAVRAVLHWAACERAMRQGKDLPVSRFPTVLAILVAVGAVGLLVLVLTGTFSA